jgi:magnesium chelatase subunit I
MAHPATEPDRPRTLGDLRAVGYRPRSIRDEVRSNLRRKIAGRQKLFAGVLGYDSTVIPQLVNGLLSRHDIILLGLRGQAKSRLARGVVELLDEWVPAVEGAPLLDDPLQPISTTARHLIQEQGDQLPIRWVHRDERYQEKLATPDINMADLIGDIDPIKAARERRTLMDPEIIHFGLIPRSHRCVFTINELPDLPTRLQVGLFNLLEEKDIQIRGFPLRMPLDLLLLFTANPEDYTSRGNIITPLRDRIRSQIHTHYPTKLEIGMAITAQEAWQERTDDVEVQLPEFLREAVEEVAIQARTSSFVDQASGVSARVTISLLENLISNAERRRLLHQEAGVCARPTDLFAALPGLSGKIELVFEGEQEGPLTVCRHLLGKALKVVFDRYLEDPLESSTTSPSPYQAILAFFQGGARIHTSEDAADAELHAELSKVDGLRKLAQQRLHPKTPGEEVAAMELILEGLHQAAVLAKSSDLDGATYQDQFEDMMKDLDS